MSTLRSRSIATNQATSTTEKPAISAPATSSSNGDDHTDITSDYRTEPQPVPSPSVPTPTPAPQRPSLAHRAISQTLATTANLANLLPTGTLLSFQLLTPIFTTNGVCDSATRPMTFILLSVLSLSCLLACFTDSFKSSDGQVYYGLATFKGMWLFDYPVSSTTNILDLSKYKLRFIDGVHGILSMMVFVAVALRDRNVVSCFYPRPVHEVQEVLDIVPVGIGFICSLLFVVFPTTRHGIGFPVTSKGQ